MKRLAILLLLAAPLSLSAKDDWQSDFQKWSASSQASPLCKVRYTTGIYRPGLGDGPQWGFMTENMFKWFSKDGVKLAPSVCPAPIAKASYRILFSETPVTTVSQTTHGSETRTTTQPFNADAQVHTTYPDGSSTNSTATINGQQTSTVIVPTETTISRSSTTLYMYTYRVNGSQLQLISTDRAIFSRVAASGSGDNAAGAELGAGIGNLIRASGDRGRTDKLYEEALNAIRADTQGGTVPPPSPPTQAADLSRANSATPSIPVGSDDASRAAYYRQACGSGDMQNCVNLGTMYRMGWGVSKDSSQASVLFKKGCDAGILDGCNSLESVGSPAPAPVPTLDAALQVASQASVSIDSSPSGADIEIDGAFVGDTPSTVSIASGTHQIAVKKKGFKDWSKALTVTGGVIHLSAELESVSQSSQTSEKVTAQLTGPTVAAALPSVQSIDASKEQAASSDAETQFHLGTLYETGNGVPQDYTQAVLWYRKAAEQNFAKAQYRLGVLYANGVGVPLDKAQSAAWFQKSAEQGYVYAQEMLGSDYLTGEGVQRDYAEAYFWFDIACASKAREVVVGERATQRDAAAVYLTPADLSRVQERARKWFGDHPPKTQDGVTGDNQ